MTPKELPGQEEMAAEMRGLEEIAAALARAHPQASSADEPSQEHATATKNARGETGPVEFKSKVASPIADEAAGENEPTITASDPSPLASLDSETAIRLRWALRDIRGKRTKLSPLNSDDLRTLVKMALLEIRDNVPVLTSKGHWALD